MHRDEAGKVHRGQQMQAVMARLRIWVFTVREREPTDVFYLVGIHGFKKTILAAI